MVTVYYTIINPARNGVMADYALYSNPQIIHIQTDRYRDR